MSTSAYLVLVRDGGLAGADSNHTADAGPLDVLAGEGLRGRGALYSESAAGQQAAGEMTMCQPSGVGKGITAKCNQGSKPPTRL